ncbi:TIGR03086 family metal-binding protein [Kibdelosporangium aridum]|uniref:TIGR03086 family metal-binding protein n=1 Tax=Kibdelosporangium aridum TaxID=2030 RepID=UPI000525E5E5
MDTMELCRRVQGGFDAVLAKVPADRWDAPSACSEWTIRDVVGHAIWEQHQMRASATEQRQVQMDGAPGSPHPVVMAGDDSVATWRLARNESVASLTEEALAHDIGHRHREVPLAAVAPLLIIDQVVHTWDIAHGLGIDVELDPELVTVAFGWARANVGRWPGVFGPEVMPPADADKQIRMLTSLGRAAWQPVAV